MPVYEPKGIQYDTISGHVDLVLEGGKALPAFWSHPNIGGTFPGVALIHDWWGIRPLERRLAQALAQMGYYVIAPDLFDTRVATTAEQAMQLVRELGTSGYAGVDAALEVMETHARSNHHVAVMGLGMGGSLAYEAAIRRDDLEAAVSFCGFPQRYLGRFAGAHAPILAVYGSEEPYIKPVVLKQLHEELTRSSPRHELVILPHAGRDFFESDDRTASQAWALMAGFFEKHLARPTISRLSP
jgi:carboxymethylenebutenolidase